MMAYKMTSEGRGVKQVGWERMGGRRVHWEKHGGIQSQVTFSRESSCEHSAPGRRVTVESSVSYTPKPRISLAAFTLHRSAITKPIKKPMREASAVSQSPLADLATRIIAQESTFQHRIQRIPAITSEYLYSLAPFHQLMWWLIKPLLIYPICTLTQHT